VAPVNDGLFIGDYQGLARTGTSLVPFFVLTESRTEVVARPLGAIAGVARRAPATADDGLLAPRPAVRLIRP